MVMLLIFMPVVINPVCNNGVELGIAANLLRQKLEAKVIDLGRTDLLR